MTTAIDEYKAFIDGLLGWPHKSVLAARVKEWGTDTPRTYDVSDEFNQLMVKFTFEQRQLMAELLQQAHEEGNFSVLSYLEPYILSRDGIELPREPFDSTRYNDWLWRHNDWVWPAKIEEVALPEPEAAPIEARVDAQGWVTCPRCGWKFSTRDLNRWVDERHRLCGQRLILVPVRET